MRNKGSDETQGYLSLEDAQRLPQLHHLSRKGSGTKPPDSGQLLHRLLLRQVEGEVKHVSVIHDFAWLRSLLLLFLQEHNHTLLDDVLAVCLFPQWWNQGVDRDKFLQ